MRFNVVFAVLAAVLLFQSAAFAGFDEGFDAYNKKDWKTAIMNLRPAAEQGDDRAMVILGNMYSEGLGVDKNLEEAFRLYRRSAEKNNAAGILATATMYQQGLGVPANGKLSIDWHRRSAMLGHQTGAFFYAVTLYQGSRGKTFDIKPDNKEAYKWFRIAAKSDANQNIKKTATSLADILAKKLTGDEITAADREVLSWKPQTAEEIGAVPEAALAATQKPAEEKPAEAAPAPKADAPQ